MRHTIAILLQNETGALSRVASMFSTRGYNIESLSVAPTQDPMVSRLTLVTEGEDTVIEQIAKQLYKLIDVIDVLDITLLDHVERELMMIKCQFVDGKQDELHAFVDEEEAKIISEADGFIILEIMSDYDSNNRFLKTVEKMVEVIAIARSGPLALAKGQAVISL
jgi:acetolactate synthase-1/3 small subunit